MLDNCVGCGKPITQANVDYCIVRLKMPAAYCYDCQMRLNVYRGNGMAPGAVSGRNRNTGNLSRTPADIVEFAVKIIQATRFCRENVAFLDHYVLDLSKTLPAELFQTVLHAKSKWDARYSERRG